MKKVTLTIVNANPVNPAGLPQFYLEHIGKIYYTCTHLTERFSEIVDSPQFEDLQKPINEMINLFTSRADYVEAIHPALKKQKEFSVYEGLVSFLEEAFAPIYAQKIEVSLRNALLLSYLTFNKSIEMGAFQVLELMPEDVFEHSISTLIKEAFTQAKMDNPLLSQLLANSASG